MQRPLTFFALALALAPLETAHACGGFFCSSSPVEQSKEVIVYAYEDDGSLTMAVQVRYQGTDEQFAWILPVPVPPDSIGVGADVLFDALHAATTPTFSMVPTAPRRLDIDGASYPYREGVMLTPEDFCRVRGGRLAASSSGGCSSTAGLPLPSVLVLSLLGAAIGYRRFRR